jgi:hypothetical protein
MTLTLQDGVWQRGANSGRLGRPDESAERDQVVGGWEGDPPWEPKAWPSAGSDRASRSQLLEASLRTTARPAILQRSARQEKVAAWPLLTILARPETVANTVQSSTQN